MTNKEKIHNGELYDTNAEELRNERIKARDLYFQLNNTNPINSEERAAIVKQLLGKCGKNPCITSPFYCDYGYNIEVGDNFYANVNCTILDGAKVTIGDNVFLAPNVGIYTAGHPLDAKQRREGIEYALPINIGNDVWIGAGVSIVPGVSIGNNCVIGAGSVVTKDIPDNTLAVGNPCKVIRSL